jgi:hypothetical protein
MSPRRYSAQDLSLLSADLGAELPAPVPRKKRSREESIMQCQLLVWWHLNCRILGAPELALFSIPNGGGRSGPIVGSILRAEGLRKGAPDLFLSVPRETYDPARHPSLSQCFTQIHGLFLELKRKDGVVSPEQEMFHEMLRGQGYRVEVVRDLMQGINIITSYLTK